MEIALTKTDLPQAPELEEIVLGAIMLDNKAASLVAPILLPEHFFDERLSKVYTAMLKLHSLGRPVDLMTVAHQLKEAGQFDRIGGIDLLLSLTERIATTAHVEEHCRIIRQQHILRQVMMQSRMFYGAAKRNADAFDLLDEYISTLITLRGSLNLRQPEQVFRVAKENLVLLEKMAVDKSNLLGIPTGLHLLDRAISGLQGGQKIVVAARPGMGKSAFALSIINQVAIEQGLPVLFFSLEMPARQQEMRLKAMRTGIPFHRLQKGNLYPEEWPEVTRQSELISDAPIFIDDAARLTPIDLRSKCMQVKHQHGLALVVVDYMQLMQGSTKPDRWNTKEREIAEISRASKQLALDLDVPVLEVSQLNRNVEQRSDKRPQLSDLRESGAIEQDADIVMFLYRQAYYDALQGQRTENNTAELIIAKHRNGPCKTVNLQFEDECLRFGNGF